MRTKQEVINFLESKLGTKVPCKGNPSLDGQCVTLIKALMEFLGVPDPYKARGNANTAISAYLNEGIADPGAGFIAVFSNKNMAGGVGHIWCNAGDGDGTYYESNGVKPLITTKGKTYSYDSICNFDKYIKEEDVDNSDGDCGKLIDWIGIPDQDEAILKLTKHLGNKDDHCNWGSDSGAGYLGQEREKNKQLTEENEALKQQNTKLAEEIIDIRGESKSFETRAKDSEKKHDNFVSQLAQKLGSEGTESIIIGEVERLITSESDGAKKARDLQNAMDEQERKHKEEIGQLKKSFEMQNAKLESMIEENQRMIEQNKRLIGEIEDFKQKEETTKRINLVIADIINFFKKGK